MHLKFQYELFYYSLLTLRQQSHIPIKGSPPVTTTVSEYLLALETINSTVEDVIQRSNFL
jgi:hypothetical protein